MNSRLAFVVIGLAINFLVLGRGVLLMLVLDYNGLGLVALVQAYILFGGLLHFGLLNGGYRLLCNAGPRHRQRIIDLAYTAFASLAAIFVALALVYASQLDTGEYRAVAGMTALGALATLLRAWTMNEMVAAGRLKAANLTNAVSIGVSLGLLALLPLAPTLVAVGSIVAQPVVFVVVALASGAVLRPSRLRMPKRLVKVIFRTGFVLFLTGIAIQFNSLLERSYVSNELGLEPLGRLYLAFLFLNLFQMVPTLLEQVFLPSIVKAHKAGEESAVRAEMVNLIMLVVGYCALAALALWLIAPPLLELVLPKYVPDLRWVYLLAPGLIVFTLSAPFALMFNVIIDYRWYVIGYGASVVATVIAFAAALLSGQAFSLDRVVMLRSGIYALMAVLLVAGWWRLSRNHRGFRPLAGSRNSV
ncbi:lipopolysaccharide biosynthesis protein [Erythrobacter sp. JK5]|uniref:lipopolysaccharide biosynthesis protein n=1 Tax=Erythrobacter sp. JK5 TaxID=2829500 RepID=UPI001BAA1E8F|nr:hypothetical protein [Erythrobacter sp. JK5]QUL37330.1 hypothetical protein KDC96_13320 [Erythrobacter sp. JK5]